MDAYHLKIVLVLAVGFAAAGLLGYITQRLKLSPILGYLLAGYIIGPYSPGLVVDLAVSEQLAEIGVVLMLFVVGLHLRWEDLVSVKNIALPGAIGQTLVAATCGMLLVYAVGWSLEAGIIIGLAIGVASTVVLVRVLSDHHLLNTLEGHIAIGWLIVEDILTVLVLILLPALSAISQGAGLSLSQFLGSIGWALAKFFLLALIMFTVGKKIVSFILTHVARLRSHELFTLTLLALTFVIATGSALIFGTSIALGAFLAGMIIGQTHVRHQASANALPMKDAFAVIFFLTVGMLFNPFAIADNFILFIGVLAIILIIKPLTAYLIVWALRYPIKVALTIAIALAQIGEFSFILGEEAMKFQLLPDEGYDMLVACALISIAINPLLFKLLDPVHQSLRAATDPLAFQVNDPSAALERSRQAIVVGFGPLGRGVVDQLRQLDFEVTIIERNIDTVVDLADTHQHAVFGDAALPSILEMAHIDQAEIILITVPEIQTTVDIIESVQALNPTAKILARAHYVTDKQKLDDLHVESICSEEETTEAFIRAVARLV